MLVSVMRAKKLLASGCIGLVASIVYKTKEMKLEPIDVPIVQNFVEIFPKELPRLPPKREISFEIELMLGLP